MRSQSPPPAGNLAGRFRTFLRFLGCVCVLQSLSSVSPAQPVRPRLPDYSNFDIRDDVRRDPSSPATEDFQSDLVTAPGAVYSLDGPLTGPASGDAEEIARQFLGGGAARRDAAPGAVELRLTARSRVSPEGLTHLTFRPELQGVPYFDSEVRVHLDSQGRIWRVTRAAAAAPPAGEPAKLTALDALKAAIEKVAPGVSVAPTAAEAERGPERRAIFTSAALASPAIASLAWFVLGRGTLPAWQMYLDLGHTRAYWIVIDARSGRILFSRNLTRQERPQGSVFRAPDHATPLAGPQSLEPWTGWPASYGDCPSEIYPAQFRSGGNRDRCWVRDQQTQGNNVDACTDGDGNNVCDGRAQGAAGQFSFSFTDAYDRLNRPDNDRDAALANAFYWANGLHDWLYRLGFDEAAGNFQTDNFQRGGASSDALRLEIHDPAIPNNAVFTTTPDGIAPRMELGLFSGSRRDTAFDGDIVTHEYVHGLTSRLVGGSASANGLSLWQSGAMSEGWSDVYAASLTGDAVMGEYSSRNPSTGIRSVAYDNSPYTFGMFGTLRPTVLPDSGGQLIGLPQVHRDGEIWATVLWDLRQVLGRDDFERAVTTALKLTPSRPSMLDARDAILQSAQILGAGGANRCAAWSVFAARGFGFSAATNPVQDGARNDTALSVFEAFDLPAACGGSPLPAGDVLLQEDAETPAASWTAAGAWHRSARRAASGSYTWWYGQEDTGTYDTGARNRGSLTSPAIDLSGSSGAILEWDQFLRTEGFNHPVEIGNLFGPYLNADSGRVMISNDNGSSWRALTHVAHPTPGNGFAHYRINLTRFAGQVIQLRFEFDTFDGEDNGYEGWYLDNIRVSRTGPSPARLRVEPASLAFSGARPSSQGVAITAGGSGDSRVWTASVSKGGAWLSVLPASGKTPSQVQVSVSPLSLAAGTYSGEIRVYEVNQSQPAATVSVTLEVNAETSTLAGWSFDEGGNGAGIVIADSAGGHAGTTFGQGTAALAGLSGSARVFDGAHAEIPRAADFLNRDLTLRTWIKLRDYPQTIGVIASALGGDTGQGWFLGVLESGYLVVMAPGVNHQTLWMVSRTVLTLDSWHAVVLTLDTQRHAAVLYVDGQEQAGAPLVSFDASTTTPFTIGRASWWPGYYLPFAIDETRIDANVWSADQARADFASFAPPAAMGTPPPIADWAFEENGNVLADSSAGRHDALVQGALTMAVPGIAGAAHAFHGPAEYALVTPQPELSSPDFTFSTWIRLDTLPSNWGVAFSSFDGNHRGWFTGIDQDGRVIFSLWGEPVSSAWVLSQKQLRPREWHHVAVNYDGLTHRAAIFIDGAQDRAFQVGQFTPQSSLALTFARASWFDGYYLACTLDTSRLWNAALRGHQIKQEFERTAGR